MTRRDAGRSLTWRWDIVGLGRLAGAFVIASALGLAIWNAVSSPYDFSPPLDLRFYLLWSTFVSIAWAGVAIILLAELVDRLTKTRPSDAG
jgi:hypothetical protein